MIYRGTKDMYIDGAINTYVFVFFLINKRDEFVLALTTF